MADQSFDYLYVAEWDDTVHRPPFTVMHEITLNDGIAHEEFEKFMANEGFAQAAASSTRIGQIAAQYLLRPAASIPSRVEDLDLDLSSFATRPSASTLQLVHSWRRNEG